MNEKRTGLLLCQTEHLWHGYSVTVNQVQKGGNISSNTFLV
jgi:hypothetical protein